MKFPNIFYLQIFVFYGILNVVPIARIRERSLQRGGTRAHRAPFLNLARNIEASQVTRDFRSR